MSQSYELTGTLLLINETQSFASGFRKRVFVVKTEDSKFPQDIPLEAVKDLCDILDLYDEGDPITVSFNIRGNEYNGKHYVNLQAWRFDRGQKGQRQSGATSGHQPAAAKPKTQAAAPAGDWDEDGDDEIPF